MHLTENILFKIRVNDDDFVDKKYIIDNVFMLFNLPPNDVAVNTFVYFRLLPQKKIL